MSRTTFDSKSQTVGELLGANVRERIVVPPFQRGYEWVKKHVEAFWNDIHQFRREREMAGGPDKYFLGPIVILYSPNDIISLLDGQQRLATATILLSILRDLAKDIGIKDGIEFARDTQSQLIVAKEGGNYSLELGDTDKVFFREFIQDETATKPKPKIRTHRNIKTARTLLEEKVNGELSGANPAAKLTVLRSLRQAVRSDLVLTSIPVESERDAFRIFETLNDRGLRLSVPDLLLNYLMREARPETDRKKIRELWTEMVERMGRRDINRFLRHMWVSKYGDLKAKDLFTALKEHIEANSIASLDFARSCADECEYYVQLITFDDTHLGKATKYVRRLLQGLDAQAALPLLLSAFQKLSKTDFIKVCQWLLVFVVRYYVIANLDISGLEAVLFELARDVRAKMAPNAKGVAPSSQDCLKHIKASLVKNAPSDDRIKTAVPELILAPDEAGYIMGRLAAFMQSKTKEVTIDEANLEHIFPKNPDEKEWGGKANQELLGAFLWHIGNLTMLGERLNRDTANKEYDVKKKDYAKKSELKMPKQIARDYSVWDENSIRDWANKLTDPILEVWSFDNPSRV